MDESSDHKNEKSVSSNLEGRLRSHIQQNDVKSISLYAVELFMISSHLSLFQLVNRWDPSKFDSVYLN